MGGKLIIAGGNLKSNYKKIQRLLIEYAGGTDAKIAIVPTASGVEPSSTMKTVANLWIELGMNPNNIIKLPIYSETGKNWTEPALGDNEEILQMLQGVTGFWFTGGDQYYTHKAFIRKDGTDTKILKEMKTIYKNGGVIGGTSAGAAIMSSVMIASGNSFSAFNNAAVYGYEDYDDAAAPRHQKLRLVKGLGFFTEGVIDQHFDIRPRVVRLIRAVTDHFTNLDMGYGISEGTAMIYDLESKCITVAGSGAIYILDCTNIQRAGHDESFAFENVILDLIKEGDSFDTINKTVEFMK